MICAKLAWFNETMVISEEHKKMIISEGSNIHFCFVLVGSRQGPSCLNINYNAYQRGATSANRNRLTTLRREENTRCELVEVTGATGGITEGAFYNKDEHRRPKGHAERIKRPPPIREKDDRINKDPFLPQWEQNKKLM